MNEISFLTLYLIFLLFAWLPSSYGKFTSYGKKWVSSNRGPQDKELSKFGGRAERAYNNLKDYSLPFVGSIIILMHLNAFDNTTWYATLIYLVVRILHFTSYCIGIVSLRASFWLISVICNVILLAKIF